MHFTKKLEIELNKAKERKDTAGYIKTRELRSNLSPFDSYRIKLMKFILKKQHPCGRLLDIGSNIGLLATSYAKLSKDIFLCDLDEFIIGAAKAKNSDLKNVNFTCANISRLPFKDNYFDVIVSLEAIEHLNKEDQKNALNELMRVAKHNATIYISTPNRISLAGLEGLLLEMIVRGYKWNAWDSDHKHIYSSLEFIDFLSGLGENIEIKMVYGSYFLPGSLTVRFPLWMQGMLGFLSYQAARASARVWPLHYLGFTTIVVFKKN